MTGWKKEASALQSTFRVQLNRFLGKQEEGTGGTGGSVLEPELAFRLPFDESLAEFLENRRKNWGEGVIGDYKMIREQGLLEA